MVAQEGGKCDLGNVWRRDWSSAELCGRLRASVRESRVRKENCLGPSGKPGRRGLTNSTGRLVGGRTTLSRAETRSNANHGKAPPSLQSM